MTIIQAIPLTEEAFKPFGDVVEATPDQMTRLINEEHTTRFHDMANIRSLSGAGRVSINIFRSDPCELPVTVRQMERHPKASQFFMPLSRNGYLVIVAPAGDFKTENLHAFVASPDQGVNYHPGTWHHYSLALGGLCDFLVVDYVDVSDNCDIIDVCDALQVIV